MLVAAAPVVFVAATATGQGAAAPTPVCGLVVTDPKGDSTNTNTDMDGVWFDHLDGKTFAYLRVANLDRVMAADTTFYNYQVELVSDAGAYLVYGTINKQDAESFRYKRSEGAPGATAYVDKGTTTGKFFGGKDAVVQIELPAEVGAAPGKKLTGIEGHADNVFVGHPQGTYLRYTASSDDSDPAKPGTYTVQTCATSGGGEATATATPSSTPEVTPVPSPTPSGPGPVAPPAQPGPGGSQPQRLNVTVSRKVPPARKVRKRLAITLTSRERVTNIEAALLKGGKQGKVVARGKLAAITRKAKLKLKVSRKISKGAYTLQLVGRNANGSDGTTSARLRFKK